MPNILLAVLIEAPKEKVYAAITSQEGLAEWWTPATQAKAQANTVARFPFGEGYVKEMSITELKPYDLVKWECIKGADEWVGTNISFELEARDKEHFLVTHPELLGQIEQQEGDASTLLIFRHENWKKESLMFAECSYTWGRFLRSLKLLCEMGKGMPWPQQHRVF
jgi:uncharacterized protein YndB with AHSA1/START domain